MRGLLFLLALTIAGRAQDGRRIPVTPVADLAALAERYPEGTIFVLGAGVYRGQSITPKNRQAFIADRDAILNGAIEVSGFVRDGTGYWAAPVTPSARPLHGFCAVDHPLCRDVNDVFADDLALSPAASLARLDPAHYYFDRRQGLLYLGFDPAGRRIEMAVLPFAFNGSASSVIIRGLVIEKYASRAQVGAVMGRAGVDWVIEYNIVRFNHGVGIAGGPRARVRDNAVLWNGQLGVAADGDHGLFEGNEIAYNNRCGYLVRWEGGGSKFAETSDLTVRYNYVHHNFGFGLWTDIDNVRTLYEHNAVLDNEESGIFHLISADAVIRNNYVARNGLRQDGWLWGSQILLANSWNVVVTGNFVEVDAAGGNGIGMIQQDRGSGALGPRLTRGNSVVGNEIVYAGEAGISGIAADFEEAALLAGNNRFDSNLYRARREARRWMWGELKDWRGFLEAGQEGNGIVAPEGR